MQIGILKADSIRTELAAQFGDYPELFARLFHPVDPDIRFTVYDIPRGHWPDNIDEVDAWLVTGCRHSVYDPLDWILPLKHWVTRLHQAEKKLLGICFGHQLIAEALGGRVQKADYGWHIGRRVMQLNPAANNGLPDQLSIPFFHQDQIIELPPEAVNVAATEHCPYSVGQIGQHIIMVQGHPEYSDEFSRALYLLRQSEYGVERYEQGIATLSQSSNQPEVARWLVEFLKR